MTPGLLACAGEAALTHSANRLAGTSKGEGGESRMLSNVFVLAFGLIERMRAEEGQTMAEYGLLLAVIAVVVVAAAVILGTDISSLFIHVANDL